MTREHEISTLKQLIEWREVARTTTRRLRHAIDSMFAAELRDAAKNLKELRAKRRTLECRTPRKPTAS